MLKKFSFILKLVLLIFASIALLFLILFSMFFCAVTRSDALSKKEIPPYIFQG